MSWLGEDTWKISIWIWFFKNYFRVCSSFHVHYNSVGSMRSSVTNDKTEKFSWSSLFIHSFFKLTYNHTAVQESLILFLVCFTFFIYVHESWVNPFHGSCFQGTLKHIMAESRWRSETRTWRRSAAKIDIFTIILTMIWSRVDKWIRNAY